MPGPTASIKGCKHGRQDGGTSEKEPIKKLLFKTKSEEVSKPIPTVTDVIPNPPVIRVFEPQNLNSTPVFLKSLQCYYQVKYRKRQWKWWNRKHHSSLGCKRPMNT